MNAYEAGREGYLQGAVRNPYRGAAAQEWRRGYACERAANPVNWRAEAAFWCWYAPALIVVVPWMIGSWLYNGWLQLRA